MDKVTAKYIESVYHRFRSLPEGSLERLQYGIDKSRAISAIYRKIYSGPVKQRVGDILAIMFSELADTTGYTLKDGVFIKDET